jgi:hypothetical protein
LAKPSNRLPDRSADARRDAALRECLREFAVRHAGDQLVGTVLPYVAALVRTGTRVAPRIAAGARLYEDVKARTALRTPFYEAGDAIVAVATVNQARALDPPLRQLGTRRRARSARPTWRRLRELSAQGRTRGKELVESVDRSLLPSEVDPLEFVYAFHVGAAMLALAERALTSREATVAVIGSPHGLPGRALAHVARERGIASVYIPHAPVLGDAELVDLPVDYAALRGPGELDHYTDFGVDRARLDVAGDTSIDGVLQPAVIDPDRPIVFAPSPDPPDQLEAMVALIAASTDDPVVVSPHPRSDVRSLRAVMPAAWSVWEGRTLDVLRQGPPVLIQRSSGVALEAMQLGVPVIELSFSGDTPGYPFIRDPFARFASDAEQLGQRLGESRNAEPAARAELAEWASKWVAAAGPEAASRAAAVIDRASAQGPLDPIWDAWG